MARRLSELTPGWARTLVMRATGVRTFSMQNWLMRMLIFTCIKIDKVFEVT